MRSASLVLAGVGSNVQHPRASLLVTNTYGKASRGPLGIYNFAGDLGNATFPAAVALLLPIFAWRPVVAIMSLVGLAVAAVLLALVPRQTFTPPAEDKSAAKRRDGSGFGLLFIIGALDTATRMGYLLFLPFLLHARGGAEPVVGLGLALLFIGGALGKAACGWLGQHLGVVWSVIVTEAATALLMIATLILPLAPMLTVLPLLGIVLNGTSAVFLREWKSRRVQWITGQGAIPRIPEVRLETLAGISLPLMPGSVTSEDCQRFRDRHLVLRNPNRVSHDSLSPTRARRL